MSADVDALEEQLASMVDTTLRPGLTEAQVRLVANRLGVVPDVEHAGLYWTGDLPVWGIFVSLRPCRDELGAFDVNIQIDSADDRETRLPSIKGETFLAIADDFRRIREAVIEAHTARAVAEGRVTQ